MTITNGYATVADLSARLSVDDSTLTPLFESAITAASRAIDSHCGRFFYAQTNATSAVYGPESNWIDCYVDDISSTSGLLVKVGLGGSYTTTLTQSTDFE